MDSSRLLTSIIRLFLTAVFLGICLMWIITPTNAYTPVWKAIVPNKILSTYFGTQATSLFIWTLPVLFFAALGSLYLHLGKKLNQNYSKSNGKKDWFDLWKKRPMLVKGPLGIVSATELAFFTMFIALLVWTLGMYLHKLKTVTPQEAEMHRLTVGQYRFAFAAWYIGLVGDICLAFLFYPVARGSSVLPLFGLTSEGSIKYHIWIGHITMVLFTAHGVGFVVYWAATGRIEKVLEWGYARISNLAGEISLLGGLGLWAACIPRIRRKFFELFFYTHHLYIIFMLFYILHVGISCTFMVIPGFILFLIDRYIRFLQSRTSVRLLSARVLPCNAVELNFAKSHGLTYNPTSTMFVNVPSISRLQWHPFTICSNSNLETDQISVLIKCEGSWSTKLYDMLSSPIERLDVSLEGPYGPQSNHFLRHDTVVMVSGGSGITPFISIIRELIFRSKISQLKTPDMILIPVFKSSMDLTMLDLLLPMTGSPSELSNLNLQIEAYVTKDKEPVTENSKRVRSIWFKPLPTDKPMAAILGHNNWLWLSAIISSSTIMFMVLIGIITRFYIYPIDHNNYKFSYTVIALLNLLAICFAIATTAGAAVFWNKRRYAKEANQVQNMEGSSNKAYNADRELESLPFHTLAEVTNIHYGRRPDLKKMLFECKGKSVGVLVCGPTELRHDVAAICSSGLADNLHFESISFSW